MDGGALAMAGLSRDFFFSAGFGRTAFGEVPSGLRFLPADGMLGYAGC